ncbi:MAG: DNA polymerase III subunit alpha, partial [Flavobacteriales bacterium]|nr:DNA polymerase III subunit alpha [Flavobacteriales bacterium]
MYLNCHSYYSFKYGTLSIDQLLQKAKQKGVSKFVLTDINNTSGCFDFIQRAKKLNINPVLGIDFRNGAEQQFIGIAKNNKGFKELNETLTYYLHSGLNISKTAPDFSHAFVIYPFQTKRYRDLKDNEYIGIRPSEIRKLPFTNWKNHQNKLVILQPVTLGAIEEFDTHRFLRAIDTNSLLSMLPEKELADPYEIMVPELRLEEIFKDYPTIIQNTKLLLSQCSIDFDFTTVKNKQCFTHSISEDLNLIRKESIKGLKYRYGNAPTNVIDRMEKELKVIEEKCFSSYFLINWDMVNYARSQNFYYVGRGSGANSMVAYLLRITDVDPIELDLYFERFISPERSNLPDFDIDFSSIERNNVTKYLFDTYGWDKTALVGSYNTFKGRATLRELGKVYGMPNQDINKMQKAESYHQLDEMAKLVVKHYKRIEGLPNHLSVHSSGIIISDEPINTYTATMMPPKGFPTTHFSMIEAEDIGLHKFDILGQRGLGKIKDSISIIKHNRNIDVDIHQMKKFKEDAKIKALLKVGDCTGCFYVESPGMRMLLTKLKADDYLRLVAASSIIRPGVAQSGMMNQYIKRFHRKELREKAKNDLPDFYNLLEETYGVMVYQEDVIKVAHYFAGLTLTEADILRRGMSWKFRERNEFHKVKDKFFSNCKQKGYQHTVIQKIWEQIESFGNYAFAKGHSASYAVESYQALYLKAHYPIEYLVATVNNGGGFFRTEIYFHEARMNGATLQVPCVNNSEGLTTVYVKSVFIGLRFMNGLALESINQILIERYRNGPFLNLRDFIKRVPIILDQLRLLIRVGAFRFTGRNKKELLWDAHFLLGNNKKLIPTPTLFNIEIKKFKMPELWSHPLEDAFDELELLGFSVNISPFDLLEETPDLPLTAKELRLHLNKTIKIVGYLVHVKRTQTHKGEGMNFGTWLDLNGHWMDTVHFPQVAKTYPFRGPGCYLIKGKVVDDFGFISIDVQSTKRLPTQNMDQPSVRLRSSKENFNKPNQL